MKSTYEAGVSIPRSRSALQLAQLRVMQLIAAGQLEALRHDRQIPRTQKKLAGCSRPA